MLPKDDLYIPPLNIKVKDQRSFGRKPIVGYHILKSLELYRCDPNLPTLTIIPNDRPAVVPAVTEGLTEKKLLRKTKRKGMKHFWKKFKPTDRGPSKLAQLQQLTLQHHQMPIDRMVRGSLLVVSLDASLLSLCSTMTSTGGRSTTPRKANGRSPATISAKATRPSR